MMAYGWGLNCQGGACKIFNDSRLHVKHLLFLKLNCQIRRHT
jgi:hypothetical protein